MRVHASALRMLTSPGLTHKLTYLMTAGEKAGYAQVGPLANSAACDDQNSQSEQPSLEDVQGGMQVHVPAPGASQASSLQNPQEQLFHCHETQDMQASSCLKAFAAATYRSRLSG